MMIMFTNDWRWTWGQSCVQACGACAVGGPGRDVGALGHTHGQLPSTEGRQPTAGTTAAASHDIIGEHTATSTALVGLCFDTDELASQSSSSSAESAEDAARNAAVMRSRAEAESAREAARAAARSEHRPLAELSLSPVGLRSLKWHSPLAGALSLSLSVASTAHTPMVRARLAG